jgi:hypothetical protein
MKQTTSQQDRVLHFLTGLLNYYISNGDFNTSLYRFISLNDRMTAEKTIEKGAE